MPRRDSDQPAAFSSNRRHPPPVLPSSSSSKVVRGDAGRNAHSRALKNIALNRRNCLSQIKATDGQEAMLLPPRFSSRLSPLLRVSGGENWVLASQPDQPWSASRAARIIRFAVADSLDHAAASRAKSGSISVAVINGAQPLSPISVATLCATELKNPAFCGVFVGL